MGVSPVTLKRIISLALVVSVLFVTFQLTRVNKSGTEPYQITDTVEPIKRRGGVSDLEKIHFEEVNHKDAVQAYKQVIIKKGQVPALNMFGRAIIRPNGKVPTHTHDNMDEIFYCVDGSGEILVDNKPQKMEAGITIHVASGEEHSVINTGAEDNLVFLYFGIAV